MLKEISDEEISFNVFFIGGKALIFDWNLAEFFGIKTATLNGIVNKNIELFTDDFVFRLNQKDFNSLKSQFGSMTDFKDVRRPPYAFTEQGVAELSNVFGGDQVIVLTAKKMNEKIKRVFSKLWQEIDGDETFKNIPDDVWFQVAWPNW